MISSQSQSVLYVNIVGKMKDNKTPRHQLGPKLCWLFRVSTVNAYLIAWQGRAKNLFHIIKINGGTHPYLLARSGDLTYEVIQISHSMVHVVSNTHGAITYT